MHYHRPKINRGIRPGTTIDRLLTIDLADDPLQSPIYIDSSFYSIVHPQVYFMMFCCTWVMVKAIYVIREHVTFEGLIPR